MTDAEIYLVKTLSLERLCDLTRKLLQLAKNQKLSEAEIMKYSHHICRYLICEAAND